MLKPSIATRFTCSDQHSEAGSEVERNSATCGRLRHNHNSTLVVLWCSLDFISFYLYIYSRDSQESDGGANT